MMGSAPHMGMNLGQEDELTLSVETGEDNIQGKLTNIINIDSVREGLVRSCVRLLNLTASEHCH